MRSFINKFRPTNQRSQRRGLRGSASNLVYQQLEGRKVLASFFPAYVDGTFSLGDPDSAAPYPLADTFKLETNPGATRTIYLDYDGHFSRNNAWDHSIRFPAFDRDGNPSSFSSSELIEIQLQFQNVAEDFAPFDVNVTTKDPGIGALTRAGLGDQRYGVRSVNTQATGGFGSGIGGVAYVNSFSSFADNPVFVFNKGTNAGGQTNSHEIGHALGLYHDGLYGSTYHPGSGTGETSWGPLLGAPFSSNVTQWSNGDYAGSTASQDDLAIITNSFNGIRYKADDHGGNFTTASDLGRTGTNVFDWGVVGRRSDLDMFRFTTGAGTVRLSVNPFGGNPNLDVLARIHDSSGRVVATNNPANRVGATFNATLPAGEYFVSVDGIGKPGVYSDYGSLGFYTIEGTVVADAAVTAVGESGRLARVNDVWQTVTLSRTYANPVVIAGPASTAGGDPVTVRVRNVTGNSFQIRIDEWEYRDGRHGVESVDYLVVESGTHTLADGTTIVAGKRSGQTHRWQTYNFGGAFSGDASPPIVLAQTTTINENTAVTNRFRNVSVTGFQLKLQEEQASDFVHAGENVSWIAIEAGSGSASGRIFSALRTPNSVTHDNFRINFGSSFGSSTPAFFADMQSFNGGDTATVRYRALSSSGATVFLEEEQSADLERAHIEEVVGYLAITPGTIFARDGRSGIVDSGGASLRLAGDSSLSSTTFTSTTLTSIEQSLTEAASLRASMNQRGLMVDGDLTDAALQLEAMGEVYFPLVDSDGDDQCGCGNCGHCSLCSQTTPDETVEASNYSGVPLLGELADFSADVQSHFYRAMQSIESAKEIRREFRTLDDGFSSLFLNAGSDELHDLPFESIVQTARLNLHEIKSGLDAMFEDIQIDPSDGFFLQTLV